MKEREKTYKLETIGITVDNKKVSFAICEQLSSEEKSKIIIDKISELKIKGIELKNN